VFTFTAFTNTDRAQDNLLSFLSTTFDAENAIDLLTITHWLQEYKLVDQKKLIDFLRITASTHGFPLWQQEEMIIERFPTLIPLIHA
jgi:hypothetical protein